MVKSRVVSPFESCGVEYSHSGSPEMKVVSTSTYKSMTFSYSGGPITCNRAVKDREEWLKTNQWDTISATRHVPLDVKYVVVDVETHDWNTFQYNDHSKSRIVEMAWLAYDATGEVVDSKQYLIKPYGYESISRKATELHGITTEYAREHGSEASPIFDEFTSILETVPKDGFVIAYNMEHENRVFENSFSQEQLKVWTDTPKCDTYEFDLWRYLPCKTFSARARKYGKNLRQIHSIIYPDRKGEMGHFHFASLDAKLTWDIFQFYNRHASYNELKWKYEFPVSSSVYTGIKVNSNLLPIHRRH